MKAAPWIIAAVAVALCVFILYSEREAMDNDEAAWRAERDSIIAAGDRMAARAMAAEATMDSLRYHTDSIIATFEPETVTVAKALKFFEFAPLQTAIDTLQAE